MSVLKSKLTLVVLGRSGSGKGTQARLLIKYLGKSSVAHLETGRFLRELVKKYKNPTTIRGRDTVMEKGKLFPSWFPVYTWLKLILEQGIATKHWIYDGAPRRLWEAKLIDEVVAWHQRPLPIGIYIKVHAAEATKRLRGRARADDIIASIKNRMSFFDRDVIPVINHYRKQSRLITVNGDQPVDAVRRAINRALKERLGRKWPDRK